MSVGRLQVAVLVGCILCQMSDVVFVGRECLLLCGVSDDRCIGFNFAGWLSGGCMLGCWPFCSCHCCPWQCLASAAFSA